MSNPVVIDATPGQSYADITREFEAPAAVVFHAHADSDLFKTWIGPRGYETRVTHWDFRTGGGYRFEQGGDEGRTHGFRGVFHTVRENELIIQTFEWEGSPTMSAWTSSASRIFPAGGRVLSIGACSRAWTCSTR